MSHAHGHEHDRGREGARRPLTIAIGPHAYVPGLCSAGIAFVFTYHEGLALAGLTALVDLLGNMFLPVLVLGVIRMLSRANRSYRLW